MKQKLLLCPLTIFLLFACSYGQSADQAADQTVGDKIAGFPSRFLERIHRKTANLDKDLTRQTEKYLEKIQRREAKLQQKLARLDSNAAKDLFEGSAGKYAALAEKMRTDTGSGKATLSGEYQPHADSLNGMLGFLQQKMPGQRIPGIDGATQELQTLQAKMEDAGQVKEYIRQRRQQIGDYISQHAGMAGALGKEYQDMNQDLYYYSQSVRQYKEMLNDPDKMEEKALSLLNKLPAFQAFMKNNSQLAGLFSLPSNYGSPASLAGLQTRDQVSALINGQVAAGGSGGASALQANLETAQSQLDGYKDKLSQLGHGSGDIDMPDFKPNNQKTRTFWRRLEYGANFQTTRNNYYFPTVSDLGLSVGYKINNSSTAGIGASYKLAWGNGIQHVAFSSQGLGLRSFIDVKIKGSFFASGGFEYNYTTPFRSMQQLHKWDDWTRSGLIGISKTVSVKSRVFRKTKVQLLWDFLSYQQAPATRPVLFRIGYMW